MSKRGDAVKGTIILSAATYTAKKFSGFKVGANGCTVSLLKINGVDTDVKTTYFLNGLILSAGDTFFLPNGEWIHAITFTDGPISAVNF